MIVFLSDPTGLSAEAERFYRTQVIEGLMGAEIHMRMGWSLRPPTFAMYDCDPRGEPWYDDLLRLNAAIQGQAFAGIAQSDVALIMTEGTQVPEAAAVAMGHAHALAKPVLVFRFNAEQLVGRPFADVGLPAEYVARASGGAVITAVDEFLAELARLDGATKALDEEPGGPAKLQQARRRRGLGRGWHTPGV